MRIRRNAAFLGGLLLAACSGDLPEGGRALPDLRPYADLGGDFALVDQRGERFALEDMRGRMALIFFGYTFCPDFCPSTLSRLSQVRQLLGADSLATIFISVDTERDSPEVLRQYLAYFPLEVVGLTGSRREVSRVVDLYRADYEIEARDQDGRYLINHSTDIYLVDPEGRVRYLFDYDAGPEQMAEIVGALRQGLGGKEWRRAEDDALLAARDLGNYGCGTWRQGRAADYNFWHAGGVVKGRQEPSAGTQPAYQYGLEDRKP